MPQHSATSTVEPPSQLTPDDALSIAMKLQEVYLDKHKGYGDGWTDAKVAADLNVPRAWVKQVRVKVYGDGAAGNDDIAEQISEARKVLADCHSLHNQITAVLTGAQQQAGGVMARAERIEKQLAAIEKALR